MYEQIRDAIQLARATGQKIAMFHYQVLTNASALRSVDAVEFCRTVGVRVSFATEFRKMLALASLMQDEGAEIVRVKPRS